MKLVIDATLIVLSAVWAWFVSFSQVPQPGSPLPFLGVVISARLALYMAMRLHRLSWLNVSRYEVFWLAVSALLGIPLILFFFLVLPQPFTLRDMERPHFIVLTEPALYLLLLCGARISTRALLMEGRRSGHHKILIVGARDAGRSLAFQLQESNTHYEVIGFVDDDTTMQQRRIRGLPVLGGFSDMADILASKTVHEVVIAYPSLAPERLREILTVCSPSHIPVRILPPLKEMIGGQASFRSLREVRMEDLLPRPEVNLDRAALASYLKGRVVLVTGGGGSIGGELCRQVLDAGAAQLIVLGRGENSVFEMMQELQERNADRDSADRDDAGHENADQEGTCRLTSAICDVRDRAALQRIFDRHRPHVVFHAAAHKHVPLMEEHPCEAVKNNVGGTLNVTQLAVEYNVERLVLISTDKAVDPSSVMGATKRVCELIVRGHAAQYGRNMVGVRFGNVLGSRGSVVPTMARQIRHRLPVTVTDPEMVRYFMTIPEAVQLVLQAGAKGGEGPIYLLEMGRPVRILDLAYDLIRLSGLVPEQDIPIRIIGRRPGEKVEEVLLTASEDLAAAHQGDFHVAPAADVHLSRLLAQLDELLKVAHAGNETALRQRLEHIVPNYKNQKTEKNTNASNDRGNVAPPILNSPTPDNTHHSNGDSNGEKANRQNGHTIKGKGTTGTVPGTPMASEIRSRHNLPTVVRS